MKLLVIGDKCTDVFVYGSVDRVCPEAPVCVLKSDRQTENPGMAANVFANLKRLGGNVDLITNQELIKKIKDNVKNAYFPEHEASNEYKKPMLVTALGALTKFNITIDNGISHMLSFSNNKNYIFYNHSSQKFLPLNGQSFAFDCKLNNTSIDQLSAEKIIEFIQNN